MDPHTDKQSSKYGYQFKERDIMKARRNPEAYETLLNQDAGMVWTNVFTKDEGQKVLDEELKQKFPKLKHLS